MNRLYLKGTATKTHYIDPYSQISLLCKYLDLRGDIYIIVSVNIVVLSQHWLGRYVRILLPPMYSVWSQYLWLMLVSFLIRITYADKITCSQEMSYATTLMFVVLYAVYFFVGLTQRTL